MSTVEELFEFYTLTFIHNFFDIPEITAETTDNGRFYTTPQGNRYPSVTTFLSRFSDNSWLVEWKEAVGEDKAKRVSTQASGRGTRVHNILEQIVLNNPKYAWRQMPNNIIMAESIAKLLRENVEEVYGIETGLWSDTMRIAGRADLIANWKGTTSLIDFKTSKWPKTEDKIHGYFLQCTLYALMVEEIMQIEVPQIVVLIGVDFEDAQSFIKDKAQYVEEIKGLL